MVFQIFECKLIQLFKKKVLKNIIDKKVPGQLSAKEISPNPSPNSNPNRNPNRG